jgi:hypothetical protein
MAQIQFINSYKKVTVETRNGIPVLENGQVVKTLKTMYRYGVVDATPQELSLYRRSKVTEGADYYKEENGTPLWHTSDFKGFKCTIRHYEKEGQVRFIVDSSTVDAYTAIADKHPQLAGAMSDLIAAELLAGGRLDIDTPKTVGSPKVEDTSIDNSSKDNAGDLESAADKNAEGKQ